MSLKRFTVALGAMMVLGAIVASSAFATASVPSSARWIINGTALSGSNNVECEASGTLTLKSKVLGAPVKITATGVKCIESKITQSGSAALDSGKLKFEGVSVVEPAKCSTTSTIETKQLNTQLYEEGSKVYDRFVPATPEVFAELTLTGAECSIKGTYPVKGEAFGEANATKVKAVKQPLTFSGTINETASGKTNALRLGNEPATIEGKALNFLSTTNVGKEWWAEA